MSPHSMQMFNVHEIFSTDTNENKA